MNFNMLRTMVLAELTTLLTLALAMGCTLHSVMAETSNGPEAWSEGELVSSVRLSGKPEVLRQVQMMCQHQGFSAEFFKGKPNLLVVRNG